MNTGTITLLKSNYGLITFNSQIYLFFITGTDTLQVNDTVSFDIVENGRFSQAINVKKGGE